MSEDDFGEGHNSDNLTLERQVQGLKDVIEQIEVEQQKIDAINEKAKEEKASHRDEIARLEKIARDDFNIEKKALSTLRTKRRQERRMQARIDALPETAKIQYDMFDDQYGQAVAA